MIGIINYNMGNLASVFNACHLLDGNAEIVSDPNRLKEFVLLRVGFTNGLTINRRVFFSVCHTLKPSIYR